LFSQESWVERTVKFFFDVRKILPYEYERFSWDRKFREVIAYYEVLDEKRPDEIWPKNVGVFHKTNGTDVIKRYDDEDVLPLVYVYDNGDRFYGVKNYQVFTYFLFY